MTPDSYRQVSSGFVLDLGNQVVPLDARGFSQTQFRGEYPIAKVRMSDAGVPLDIELEAFSPFSPTEDEDSSLPATILSYKVTNTSGSNVGFRLGGWLENATSRQAVSNGSLTHTTSTISGSSPAVLLTTNNSDTTADSGSMAIGLLDGSGDILNPSSLPSQWTSGLSSVSDAVPANAGVVRSAEHTLAPGESREFNFVITWHFANANRGSLLHSSVRNRGNQRNYYAKTYTDAAAVLSHIETNAGDLIATTRLWRDTWYDSSLPNWFLDRTFLNTSSLATTMAYRLHDTVNSAQDGRVYFWEGVYRGAGTCTHVTHYEQAFGRMFPDAARAQRKVTDFGIGWNNSLGYVQYRAEYNVGAHFGIPHAIDGHAGTILRTYREHTTSSDNSFLTSVWPQVKRATQFMIDQDAGAGFFTQHVPAATQNQPADGVLEGPQYHTLDRYWRGVIPWISGLYLASLRASAEMADEMGDTAFATTCRDLANSGGTTLSNLTFNSSFGYYTQVLDPTATNLINPNNGSHIDQVMGDYWTHQTGLEQVLPVTNTQSALKKLFEHNFFAEVGPYRATATIHAERFYADDDEPGMIICTFPNGGADSATPEGGLIAGYFTECMTGFTYQAAAHMISEGLVTEGLALCRGVHDRYAEAPLRRNPFNEIEYGNHYSRAMSGYAPFVSISGFRYHGPKGMIGFEPKLNTDNFKAAFVAAEGWGSYARSAIAGRVRESITLKNGQFNLKTFECKVPNGTIGFLGEARINGIPVDASFTLDGSILRCTLTNEQSLSENDVFEILHASSTAPADTDTDGDGLSDLEESTGIDDSSASSSNPNGYITDPNLADSDNDNLQDGDEAALGLNPLDASSVFILEPVSTIDGKFQITWPSAPGATFTVRSSIDLSDWSTIIATGLIASAGSSTSYDLGVPSGTKFYRVELESN